MKPLEGPPVSNCINVASRLVELMNVSLDTPMFGPCCKAEGVDVESGRTASPCCAELLVVVFVGYGILRTMCGPRSIPISRRGGSMSTLVRRLGTILGYILKVSHPILFISTPPTNGLYQAGRRSSHTASLSQLTVLPMSPADMFETLPIMVLTGLDAQKKSSSGSSMRSDECDETIYPRRTDDVSSKKTNERSESSADIMPRLWLK